LIQHLKVLIHWQLSQSTPSTCVFVASIKICAIFIHHWAPASQRLKATGDVKTMLSIRAAPPSSVKWLVQNSGDDVLSLNGVGIHLDQ
jgi:hypothetical protein